MIPFLNIGFSGGKYSSFSDNCKVEIAKLCFSLIKFSASRAKRVLPERGSIPGKDRCNRDLTFCQNGIPDALRGRFSRGIERLSEKNVAFARRNLYFCYST